MTTQTILPVNAEALKALSESKQEPAWLTDSRLASWNWLASWNCPSWRNNASSAGTSKAMVNIKRAINLLPLTNCLNR